MTVYDKGRSECVSVHLQLLLHVLLLLLQAETTVLLLLQPGLHLVQHLLQLLLLGLQSHPHLLSLGIQLRLRLELHLQLRPFLHQLWWNVNARRFFFPVGRSGQRSGTIYLSVFLGDVLQLGLSLGSYVLGCLQFLFLLAHFLFLPGDLQQRLHLESQKDATVP